MQRRMDDLNCIITCLRVITGCCCFAVLVPEAIHLNTLNTTSLLCLGEERQKIHKAKPE